MCRPSGAPPSPPGRMVSSWRCTLTPRMPSLTVNNPSGRKNSPRWSSRWGRSPRSCSAESPYRNQSRCDMPEDNFSLAYANVAIIGLGLMGGSLALALKGKCGALMGIDSQPATLELALRQSIIDRADIDPARLLPEADIVILAAPVAAILSLLEIMPSFTPNPCIVIDLGST